MQKKGEKRKEIRIKMEKKWGGKAKREKKKKKYGGNQNNKSQKRLKENKNKRK